MRMKGISRIDQESRNQHGWFVRVRWHGKTHSKWFADKPFGGKRKALVAASAWRDVTEQKLGKPQTDRTVVPQKANTGIYYTEKDGYPAYEVTWMSAPGHKATTTISIRRHGKREALRMARELRAQKLKESWGVQA